MLLRSLWMCVSSYSFIQIVKLASSRMFCQRNLCLHVCWNARCVTVLMFYGLHVYSDLKIIKIQAHILMHAMKQITEHTTRRSLVKNIFPLYSQRVTCQINRWSNGEKYIPFVRSTCYTIQFKHSRQIFVIDKGTICASLSTRTSPITECEMPLIFRKFATIGGRTRGWGCWWDSLVKTEFLRTSNGWHTANFCYGG